MQKLIQDLADNLLGYYNEFVVLLPKLILAILAFSILFFIANRTRNVVNKNLSTRMDDPLLARFIARVVKISIVVFALMIVMRIIGLADVAAGIVTGASVSAIVIGFAFKDIGENFLAGIMLAFNRPFRVGDTVELDGNHGKVVSLDMRSTHIKSFDGKDIYIPNASVVKNPVVNYTIDGFVRQEFNIGLDYGSDIDGAIEIMNRTIRQVPGVLTEDKEPSISIGALNASTINITARYWLDTFDSKYSSLKIRTQAINQSLIELDKAGYYLPGDVVELKNYQDVDLKTKANAN
ncbi:MAG: mechanosensitive ion channel family protein [Saprospiraceae bacterium]